MDVSSATVTDLLCMAEIVPNLIIKKNIHKTILKLIFEQKFILDESDNLINDRIKALYEELYSKEEIFYFNYLNKNKTLKRKIVPEVQNKSDSNDNESFNIIKKNKKNESVIKNRENLKTYIESETLIQKTNDDFINLSYDLNVVNMKTKISECEQLIHQFGGGGSNEKKDNQEIFKNCEICTNKKIYIKDWSYHLSSNIHLNNVIKYITMDKKVEILKRAFNSKITSYKVFNFENDILNCQEFFISIKNILDKMLELYLDIFKNMKINFRLHALYSKPGSENKSIKGFNTKNFIFNHSTSFNEFIDNIMEIIQKQSEEFEESESGWSMEEILYLEVNLHKNNSLRGSSYIALPSKIKNKNAVINIKNNDHACFAWAIISAMYPPTGDKHTQRTSSYPHYKSKLNLTNVEFPMKIKNISSFEINNNISINVFGIENDEIIGPYHHTLERKPKHINLLLVDDYNGNQHYCWIKNLSRLISMQLSRHKQAKYICDGCLTYFQNKERLEVHKADDCNKIKTNVPSIGSKVSFTNPERQMKVMDVLIFSI